MSADFFKTDIKFLKGVGEERAALLAKELGIHTYGHLLNHFPFRYVDRTKFYKIKEIDPGSSYIQVRGVLKSLSPRGAARKKFLVAQLVDDTGTLELVWFQGLRWLPNYLKLGQEYVVFGKPNEFKGHISIPHPEMELVSEYDTAKSTSLQPIYTTTEKLKSKGVDTKALLKYQRALHQLMPSIPESLPKELTDPLRLINRDNAFHQIHFPDSADLQKKASFRLKFEEFFFLQLKLLSNKIARKESIIGLRFDKIGDYFNTFYKEHLPFPLTDAQKRVIKEIRQDCGSGRQMNRLLQGDVGSGKTVVALLSMLMALDNGYQAALMAPTEILAKQHAQSIAVLLQDMNVNVGLLTGSTKASQRKPLLESLANGQLHILIGTHALIEEHVKFKNLGFVVIDEQHRFGVEQRAKLWTKDEFTPHVLVMTATPIPRTLAMTLYGDLDVSIIDQMPPGRKPVKTIHHTDGKRLAVWGFLKQQIEQGRQVYIVYPLIKESEKLDLKNLEEGFHAIERDFPRPKYQVSIMHGQMTPEAKDYEMKRFIKGETNIMVATTVIEVGVNVPNASVMVIESAERFGLSQLHQLRGRVGRGADQSFCILMTSDKLGNDARQRIKIMCQTNDGFKIAEMDLQLRGAGDIEGTQQSGLINLKIGNLAQDTEILQAARTAALKILDDDPHLEKPSHLSLQRRLNAIREEEFEWGRVG